MQKKSLVNCSSALALLMSFIVSPGFAQQNDDIKSAQSVRTPKTENVAQSETLFKEQWGITDREYEKFLDVLKGPFGYYTPNLHKNPIMALGLAAETSEERRKYASRHVDVEFAKNVKVIAWQLSVSQMWNEKYAQTPRFANTEKDKLKRVGEMTGLTDDSRVHLYIETNCSRCDREFKKLYRKAKRSGGGVDVFFVGDPVPSTKDITRWALSQGLDPAEVKRKDVTLNRSDESFSSVPVVRPQ